jgi:hypothetical protein
VSGFNAPKLALCYFESGMESRSMRVWGWVLLIGGFLLCASIVWAAIGFLLMGLGLIFLQIAEDKRKRPAKLAASRPEKSDVRREPPLQELFQALTRTDKDEPEPVGRERAVVSYDEERWRLLLSNDADIARLATVLAPYGQKYVDELAAAYLVLNDKEYLPMILQKIIASARKDSGQNVAGDLHKTPNTDVVGRTLASTPRADSARVHDPIWANEVSENEAAPKEDPKQATKQATPKPVRAIAFARNLGGGATATEETDPKPAAIAALSAGDPSGGRQNAAEAINAKPPEVPAAAAGRDLTRDAREADAVDADNLNGILDRLTRVLTTKYE